MIENTTLRMETTYKAPAQAARCDDSGAEATCDRSRPKRIATLRWLL
jgi:hypothetical protein